jgi:hypothetical protein
MALSHPSQRPLHRLLRIPSCTIQKLDSKHLGGYSFKEVINKNIGIFYLYQSFEIPTIQEN